MRLAACNGRPEEREGIASSLDGKDASRTDIRPGPPRQADPLAMRLLV
jgi:hypothetical protein